ncbi:Hint domain-containing protein [Paracoccus thiocyanatus]|uniref:Hint domain-containing protein n=1 Tax=Paracoccus thiocyanatus TaxID=34006 RepID=UPI00122CC89D|nr:Hint domain-containing protein [Paracoccus thiocyanatus]
MKEAKLAVHTLGFISLSDFSATNNVAPNNKNGLTVGGTEWGGMPPAGTTISFNYEAIGSLNVESDYGYFTDDPWNPGWTGAEWPQHKQENTDEITIGNTTHATGTLQLENEYEVILSGDDGNDYVLVAISAVTVNPDPAGDWDYRTGPEHGVIGFTFQGPWPPEGTELTFVQNVDGEQIDWDNFVPDDEIPCFAGGTLILTDRGEVPIDDLRVGDLVMTRDNGLRPLRWIGSHRLGAPVLMLKPKLRPIRIRAGELGENIPATDLVVSPQHRVLVRSSIARRMFGAAEILVAAKQLLQIDGIDVAEDLAEVEYFHMLFDRHEIVISNGAQTESLYTGHMALQSVGKAAREEILALFPELLTADYQPEPARTLVSGRQGRRLAVRHAQNQKPLIPAAP